MSALQILAGPTAYQQLEQHGFNADLFGQLFAASGGPKWLSLAGLDQYLFGTFFAKRQQPLYAIGSSSGAWRVACFAQQQPLQAYERLIEHYVNQRYDTRPSADAIARNVEQIIRQILGVNAGQDIIDNPVVRAHFVVCRARGLNKLHSKAGLALGLGATAISNLLSRKNVAWHFERNVMSNNDPQSPFMQLNDLPTCYGQLTQGNIIPSLVASGSIPLLIAPVCHIEGLKKGSYYDGGITDYHFDMPLPRQAGLSLYPHFYPYMSPGWFDKSLMRRNAKANYHNGVILAPSAEFIAKLPYGKIPDREDFSQLPTDERIRYWMDTVNASQALADELHQLLSSGDIMTKVQPL
ncbi:alpha/beta hydrolase [Shewanella intestini]|uniref:Alpha/beta hydrolase n=1 Tax=Shewanella intestini TaxID=2017544 RepID=A0ABS5I2X4_9GAMM|nr:MULTISPECIES: alpha/beta hydrolase [Shewanella]MBR9728378.1 alpha/beta hydrolase [Shewanella intestini]MRG36720.1 alpha/beta hydrolase [Shewanella sp. XMDDZSB0408]